MLFGMSVILLALLVSFGINIVMFIPAYLFRTDKVTDISYSITFVAIAIFGFLRSTQTSLDKLVVALVLLWAVRLGGFLFIRISKIGRDARFDDMRERFFPFLKFWLLQGATVLIVMLAPLLGFMQKGSHIGPASWIGVLIFITGLAVESTADTQKFRYNSNPKNKGRWIDVGIWRASRHPNYLGEMMVWAGMYLIVAPSLGSAERLVALLSPAYIIGLLLFVSGVPLLEKSAKAKWGEQAEFKKYLSRVPVLIPSIRSIARVAKPKHPVT